MKEIEEVQQLESSLHNFVKNFLSEYIVRTCIYRKKTRRGSSAFMEKEIPFIGILSNKAEQNPVIQILVNSYNSYEMNQQVQAEVAMLSETAVAAGEKSTTKQDGCIMQSEPMMPPYAALYSPGGVYTHPVIPIGPHPHGQGVPSSPASDSNCQLVELIGRHKEKTLKKMGFGVPALPFTFVAHLLAVAAIVMVLLWNIHFRGGLAWEATNKNLIFNFTLYISTTILLVEFHPMHSVKLVSCGAGSHVLAFLLVLMLKIQFSQWIEQASEPNKEAVIKALLGAKEAMLGIRYHMRLMGEAAGVPNITTLSLQFMRIEPESQTTFRCYTELRRSVVG
ncbi:hypothetical protein HN873_018721 [Arachis hypogaea]